jgi:hypothetical protein
LLVTPENKDVTAMIKRSVTAALLAALFSVSAAMALEAPAPPTPKVPETVVPALENPVTGILESGKLIVTVSTTRQFADGPSVNYGYRTGQIIPVTVVISADPDVLVDTGSLSGKKLHKDGSDFEMVVPPVVTELEKNGRKITILQLMLRTWVMDPVLTLSAQFHYAIGYLPDGKTPAWEVGSTPDFVVSTSRTATESSKQLLDGDTSAKMSPVTSSVFALKYSGIVLLLAVAFWFGRRLWFEWLRADRLTAAQRAWETFHQVIGERRTTGCAFSQQQLKAIAASMRRYLDIESVSTDKVRGPLGKFFAGHPQSDDMVAVCVSALAKLDRAIYSKALLSGADEDVLIEEIKRVIPHH